MSLDVHKYYRNIAESLGKVIFVYPSNVGTALVLGKKYR